MGSVLLLLLAGRSQVTFRKKGKCIVSPMTVKICSKCKQNKDALCFVKNSQEKSGLNPSCKDCEKERHRRYRSENGKKISNWQKKDRLENSEKYKKRSKEYYSKNKDKENAKQKARYYANLELSRQRYKAQYQMNKHKKHYQNRTRNSTIQRLYGITVEDYDAMYIEQGGRCAICGIHQSELPRRLSIDHCHATGKVRGLLFKKCNAGLGQFNDSLDILKNTVRYLEMGGAL